MLKEVASVQGKALHARRIHHGSDCVGLGLEQDQFFSRDRHHNGNLADFERHVERCELADVQVEIFELVDVKSLFGDAQGVDSGAIRTGIGTTPMN